MKNSVFRTFGIWSSAFGILMLVACSPESKSVLQSKLSKVLPASKTNASERADGGWTPERISADPAGYLQYAANKVGAQIEGRKQKLAQLAIQRTDVDAHAQSLDTKVADAENLLKRMKTAMQRADDETNWPVHIAGHTFDETQAAAVVKSLDQFIADRQSLVQAYADALNRVNASESAIKADIQDLAHMREKIGLDLDRVRLNQNMAEISDLRKTETELSAFAKTLADMSDDATIGKLGAIPNKSNESVDAESLLR